MADVDVHPRADGGQQDRERGRLGEAQVSFGRERDPGGHLRRAHLPQAVCLGLSQLSPGCYATPQGTFMYE